MNLNKHWVQNINIVIFDGRNISKYDLLVMGNDLGWSERLWRYSWTSRLYLLVWLVTTQ